MSPNESGESVAALHRYEEDTGDKVVIEAWIGFFGDDAKCYIVGRDQTSFKCRVIERDKKDGILHASFEVSG